MYNTIVSFFVVVPTKSELPQNNPLENNVESVPAKSEPGYLRFGGNCFQQISLLIILRLEKIMTGKKRYCVSFFGQCSRMSPYFICWKMKIDRNCNVLPLLKFCNNKPILASLLRQFFLGGGKGAFCPKKGCNAPFAGYYGFLRKKFSASSIRVL